MRNERSFLFLGTAALAALLAGCGEIPVNGKDHDPRGFPDDPPIQQLEYPEGPYDVTKGAVITNYTFSGFVNSMVNRTDLEDITLGDFYNPHGRDKDYDPPSPEADDRLFPKDSKYGEGTPKPTVLALNLSAVWCGPCNEEAKSDLPELHAKYQPCNGEFLLVLVDGPTPGEPATQNHLTAWTKKYQEDFPAAIDPSAKLGTLFQGDAFPANILIDTTTMRIVERFSGVPDESYWDKFEDLLADPSCPK